MIKKEHSDCEVLEAGNISEMYSKLSMSCDLLFQDIALSSSHEPDSDGLMALYDVIESYPGLPIAIVTGHFYDKLREFHGGFLGRTNQIIGFLDKLKYSSEDVIDVILKAEEFTARYKERAEQEKRHKATIEQLVEARVESIKKKMMSEEEERVGRKVRESLKSLEERESLYRKAISGDDWISRIEAEYQLDGTYCTANALLLWREIEKQLKNLFRGSNDQCPTPYAKFQWIKKNVQINDDSSQLVNRARKIRNEIQHNGRNAKKSDAYEILKAYSVLRGVCLMADGSR
jgi:cell fate (sporulation/competence/biofilm development) regulator YlbF (YheA/YmcA/DUF963 family)